ncbi:MAG: vitamin B12 transporter [Enterobacterales bacterium]|jgi:vitamin B12 transporter
MNKKFTKILTSLVCLIILSSHSTFATASSDEKLIIVGTHISDKEFLNGIPKVTISSEDIEALAANSFADLLIGVPGVDIFQQGGNGGLSFLSIRGGDPNFVVILIDGVKVNDPTNSRGGAFDLGTIDPAIIEKVEIFYGSYSAVHGSDALAGVISIQTKTAFESSGASVNLKVGSNNMTGGSTLFGGGVSEAVEYNVAASFQNNDNSSFGDNFNRKDLKFSLGSTDETVSPWRISSFYAEGEASYFPEDSGGDRLAIIRTPEIREFTQKNIVVSLQHELNQQASIHLNSSLSKRQEDIINPGIASGVLNSIPAIDSQSEYKRFDYNALLNYKILDDIKLAVGVAYADENGGMDSIIDFGSPVPASYTLKRTSSSSFAELAVNPSEGLDVIAAFRYDKGEEKSVTTSRFTSRYQINAYSSLTANISKGFKLPSFFALAHPFVGNPDLKSERSTNYDLGLEYSFPDDNVSTTLSFYQNDFKNLIDFDPIAFTNVNRSTVRTKGAELSVAYQVSDKLKLQGHISYLNIDTFDSTVILRRRPEWKTGININYKHTDTMTFLLRFNTNNRYYDSSIPTGLTEMKALSRLDMSFRWEINKDYTLRLSAANLLNNQVEEAIGFSRRGTEITANLSFSL